MRAGDAIQERPFEPGRAGRVAAAKGALPAEVVEAFHAGMFRTDDVVDAVADDFAAMAGGEGWRALDRALRERTAAVRGAPPSLEALLAPLMTPPDWYDAGQIARGAAIWWRFAPGVVIGMNGSLMSGMEFGDLNKPQAFNGRSVAMAARRYEETARWVLAVSEPGAAGPGGAGFDATVRVRLVHAMVRRHLRRSGTWDTVAWGEPIHASGMALTNLAFLLMPLAFYDLVGVEVTEEETEAVRRFWQWTGYLMGVPDDLLPTSMELAGLLSRTASMIFAPPDADSEVLVGALKRGGVRAERSLPRALWPLFGPILRPPVSAVVWGASHAVVKRSILDASPARDAHLAIRALRPLVRAREQRRKRGALGTDLQIADRQRRRLSGSLALVKAAPQVLRPQDAVHAG
ncbi:oxygenase MpaB family protein [Actinomadura macrotermitis]|uniref:ER-bound oxygenase mpaB/mpaB'/Rubber oxygenase catalytic domain-containing protein n=1 Tax=Actinomadura macrotermitis TaxID=2585200 RepID=A0A7K0C0I4_9ACTN|nr:oxygenase MpaB family protein [Actinomadura macrotermitis]MQY06978.1 hypothetical protein [Actinomadura macrotermitis]